MSAALHRLLGLLHPDHALRLSPELGLTRRARGERGVILAEERRSGRVEGGAPVEEVVRCDYDGATLIGVQLLGQGALLSLRGARLEAPRAEAGAHLSASLLDEATLINPQLDSLRASGCGLRWGRVEGGALGSLALCDLVGAHLSGVHLRAAVSCDFSAASLVDCDLRGADLRGSAFHRADLRGARLDGAQVAGADFSGARGLSAEARQSLLEGGARLHGAALIAPLRRLMPGASNQRLHKLAGALRLSAILVGVSAALGAAALALTPPAAPPAPAPPPPLTRELTPEERREGQLALRALRESLQRANEEMLRRGAVNRAWPTLYEVQENRYDADGDGPSEKHELLVPAGLPDNPLTESRGGVLPYCNEAPTQDTLSGVDTDWHYCELTGRVFASAGFSGEATLNW